MTTSRSDRPAGRLNKKMKLMLEVIGQEELDANQIAERMTAEGWSIKPRAIPCYIQHHLEGAYIEVTRVYGKTSTRPLNRFKAIKIV